MNLLQKNITTIIQFFTSSPRRISLGLSILKFLRAILSVVTIILSANYFGTSLERDTWILGGSFVTITISILFGPLNEIFRAKFIHLKAEKGEDFAIATGVSVLNLITLISIFFIAFVEIYPNTISSLFAPGFDSDQKQLLSKMLRLLIPGLLFLELTYIWTSVLNTYSSFYLPDLFGFISVIINIILIIILAPVIGIYSLIISTYISYFVLLTVLFSKIKKINKGFLKVKLPKIFHFKPYFYFSLPFYLSYVFSQIHAYTERSLSTFMGVGSVSVLDYAKKFMDLPMNIMFSIVPTVLTPYLANYYASGNFFQFNSEIIRFIRMLLLTTFLIVVIFIVCPNELINLLLNHGNFKPEYVPVTSSVLQWYGLGLVGSIFYIVSGQALVAKKKANYFVIISVIFYGISILFNYIFYKKFGVPFFSFSWSSAHFIAGGILLIHLLRDAGPSHNNSKFSLIQLILLIGIIIIILLFIKIKIIHFISLGPLFVLAIMLSISIILMILSILIFNMEEKQILLSFLKKYHR